VKTNFQFSFRLLAPGFWTVYTCRAIYVGKPNWASSQPSVLMYDSGMKPPQIRFRRSLLIWLFAIFPLTVLLLAETSDFDGRPAIILRNDKIELTILIRGAMLANFVLRDDPERLSPFWNPDRAQRAAGSPPASPGGALGHFLCLDGFGAPSEEERSAGMPFHGEANGRQFETVEESARGSGASTVKLKVRLPLAQEDITRTVTALDGESVVYVNTEVENLLAIDHPLSWAEHATTGPPFLSPGNTIIEIPGTMCRVRPQKTGSTGKLAYEKDFVWPLAPLTQGGSVNLTTVPANGTSLDLATCLIDPARTYGYVTALRPDKHLLFGYVFRREEFPWLMSWMNYSGDARAARGFEFSTQPFDVSHRETVDVHEMFGAPTYKWLPAKAKLHASFLMFYTKTPEVFDNVADVTLENGRIQIRDKSGRVITLNAARPL
jgi:hypothetical protein